MHTTPELSIVIPIFNEAAIVGDSVAGLLDRLPPICDSFEILLAENGSTDSTPQVVADLVARHERVSSLRVGEPNYGKALKQGILEARGRLVICDEIDLVDLDFYRSALGLLRAGHAQMVIGSKLAPGARDDRPWLRNLATRVLNGMLRHSVGFRGTDTHGLKAFVREPLLPVVKSCVVDKNLFASEFVIRAERAGILTVEVPLCVVEKRATTINLFRRVPMAMVNLGRLVWVIRVKRDGS
jgi:glycosyltransferase involved in cell wall biosynthesis